MSNSNSWNPQPPSGYQPPPFDPNKQAGAPPAGTTLTTGPGGPTSSVAFNPSDPAMGSLAAPSFGQAPTNGPNGGDINTSAGANSYAQQMGAMGQGFMQQQGPTLAGNPYAPALAGDQSQFGAAQAGQAQTLAQLYAQSQGQGPNPAAAQMQAGTVQAQAQQQALAHSAGIGGAGALAARNALGASAALGTQGANQQAQVGAQQQAAAAQQYQSLAAQMAAQQQAQQKNAQGLGVGFGQFQQQQQGQNSANQLAAENQGTTALQQQLGADTGINVAQQNATGQQQLAQNAAQNSLNGEAVTGGTTAAAAVLALSDARAKTDLRPIGDNLADRFLEHMHPYSFKYKRDEDAPNGAGPYMGVMAQDVERVPGVGKQLVTETPRGKAINVPATTGALLAGVGRLHERLKALEGKSE